MKWVSTTQWYSGRKEQDQILRHSHGLIIIHKLINSCELQGKDENKVTQYDTSNYQTTSDTELEW